MDHRAIVESSGAEYIGRRDGIVYFRADGAVVSLYAFAVTPENVALSVKNVREPVFDFEPLFLETAEVDA
ncbi:MAG TPA: hypothetical protein VOA88_20990 [Candidatus Dormibacteraeota bacterium]|nr:hypothetical protein [Candidatus Dormibacteraeota bacterium]